jgi:carbon monoxide dehydrogenase subunit G
MSDTNLTVTGNVISKNTSLESEFIRNNNQDNSLNIIFNNLDFNNNEIIPFNDTKSLGSSTSKFKDLYLSSAGLIIDDLSIKKNLGLLELNGNTLISGNIQIKGDLIIDGSQTIINTEILKVDDNFIILNSNQINNLPDDFTSGIEINRGINRESYFFNFKELGDYGGVFEIGISGNLQPVATRKDSSLMNNNGIIYWDSINNRLDNCANIVINNGKLFINNQDIFNNIDSSLNNTVNLTTNQTIGGIKTFTSVIDGSINGNANTATTLQNARTITIGNTGKSFNGSADVSFSLSEIGALTSSDLTNYVNLTTNQTIGGIKTFTSVIDGSINGNANTATTLQNARTITIGNTGKSFNGSADVSFSLSEIGALTSSDLTNYVNLTTNQTIGGIKTFTSVIDGSINGNANTATTLQNARTITIGNTGKSFNGSADVSFSLSEIGALTSSDLTNYVNLTTNQTIGGIKTFTSDISGNIFTANKLKTPVTITIGEISKLFDGSSDISWNLDDLGTSNNSTDLSNLLVQVQELEEVIYGNDDIKGIKPLIGFIYDSVIKLNNNNLEEIEKIVYGSEENRGIKSLLEYVYDYILVNDNNIKKIELLNTNTDNLNKIVYGTSTIKGIKPLLDYVYDYIISNNENIQKINDIETIIYGNNEISGIKNFVNTTNDYILNGWVPDDSKIYYNLGSVGIGVTVPQANLDVNGSIMLRVYNADGISKGIYFREGFTTATPYNLSILTFDHNGAGTTDGLSINAYDGISFCTGSNSRNERVRIIENGNVGIGTTNPGTYKLFVNGTAGGSSAYVNTSDDRLKFQEEYIKDATQTLMKLRPQFYYKSTILNDLSNGFFESGLIAQEVYYDAPELRHIVNIPEDASGIETEPENYSKQNEDPQNDPNYNNWGSTPAGINYSGLIPYLIKSNQEQQVEINELRKENAELKNRLDKLEAIINKI